MKSNSEKVKKWRKDIKKRLVDSMGGKCVICGYNKYNVSFDIHHINSSEKEFSFAKALSRPIKWQIMVKELKKCVLLCCRCHRELHAGLIKLPDKFSIFNDAFIMEKDIKRKDNCPVCGCEKWECRKVCSRKCAAKLSRKVDWSNVDLNKFLLVDKMSLNSIGRMLNVSGNAVKKRAIKIGLLKK